MDTSAMQPQQPVNPTPPVGISAEPAQPIIPPAPQAQAPQPQPNGTGNMPTPEMPKPKKVFKKKHFIPMVLGILAFAVISVGTQVKPTHIISPVPTVIPVPTQAVATTSASIFNEAMFQGEFATDITGRADQLLAPRTKVSDCQYSSTASAGLNADEACTPGAVFEGITVSEICTLATTKTVRDVPLSVKQQVYAEYGITSHTQGEYEVDHRIALEDGGSNDIANLWPQPASPIPGFHQKDQLETYVHNEVCSGKMSLQEGWHELKDWVNAYNAE